MVSVRQFYKLLVAHFLFLLLFSCFSLLSTYNYCDFVVFEVYYFVEPVATKDMFGMRSRNEMERECLKMGNDIVKYYYCY